MKKIKVAILGATGYTGAELVRMLVRHSYIELSTLTTRQYVGKKFSQVFPSFTGICDIVCTENNDPDSIDADLVFSALPHHESAPIVGELVKSGKKVIDLSADFRIKSENTYKKWYGDHPCFDLVGEAVYGLPEIYREEIVKANLIANPGCYPTSVLLPLYPLIKEGIIDLNRIIVDSKSGVSGAGRGLSLKTHFCEVYGGFKAYNVTVHRHQPEIAEQASFFAKSPVDIIFTPHLLPIKRGILSTIYVNMKGNFEEKEIYNIYKQYYSKERFIRIFEEDLPTIESVVGSNFCDIGFKVEKNTKTIIIISTIDNLIKGASGQAIQNMNIMFGFPEESSLENIPLFP
ncbi:MAG: N-acetyl-gamma-glutamyl-phosphate reductase [Proteobacteria bacterium]|nr:N-acetyl-gamma-glutamyl-phosphate reductase [Pseudomonadota bacterium]